MLSDFEQTDRRIKSMGIPMSDLITYFKTRCMTCGHHRIMHDDMGACDGVMNKPCMSGCDKFIPE